MLYNVTPGSYFLTARSMDSGKLMAARMPLEVGSAPVENLSLQLTGGVDLTGRVKVEGSDTVTGNVRVSLTLRQGITMGGGPARSSRAALKDDGSFVVSAGVQPDVYDVRVSGVPDAGATCGRYCSATRRFWIRGSTSPMESYPATCR